jgi:hypothetical protein
MNSASLMRPAQLTFTPRFETDHFGIDLPLSLYDFNQPRIGISMRLGIFTFGTDKLGGFFNLHDFTGLDFYFGIKLSFIKGNCKNSDNNPSCSNSEYKKFIKK